MHSFSEIVGGLVKDYFQNTPKRLQLIDAYLVAIMLTGIIQFVYCAIVGTFPFNAFLSGFFSCVGSFVLTGIYFVISNSIVSLRMTVSSNTPNDKAAFGGYTFCMLLLFLVAINFMG